MVTAHLRDEIDVGVQYARRSRDSLLLVASLPGMKPHIKCPNTHRVSDFPSGSTALVYS
jgi:hypothetical protein